MHPRENFSGTISGSLPAGTCLPPPASGQGQVEAGVRSHLNPVFRSRPNPIVAPVVVRITQLNALSTKGAVQ